MEITRSEQGGDDIVLSRMLGSEDRLLASITFTRKVVFGAGGDFLEL